MDYIDIYVSPNGDNIIADDFTPSENDDSYAKHKTIVCDVCEEMLEVSYREPIASCKCNSQEWYL